MSTEDLKAKMRRLYEDGWSKGNLAVFDEVYAANVTYHHPTNPQKDREGLKGCCTHLRTTFPDLHIIIDDVMAAEGHNMVCRWTFEGTDTGGSPASGTPPIGKHWKVTGINLYRFEGGKIVEEWEAWGFTPRP